MNKLPHWNVEEEVYRADNAISYSTLSSYAKNGLQGLKNSLERVKIDSDSIRHGSLVDSLLTEPENFEKKFIVSAFNMPSDTIKGIIDLIWDRSDKETFDLSKLDKKLILECCNCMGYGASNWKDDTKINKIIDEGEEYFNLLPLNRIIISQYDYNKAVECVETLKTNRFTKWIFDELNSDMRVFYQLKFKISYKFDGCYPYDWKQEFVTNNTIRCMFDIIVIDYEKKTITPIDLKTTGKSEEFFIDSIQDWYYDLQATMYSYILRQVCKYDFFFKDFKVLPFQFMVINKFTLSPQFYTYNKSIADIQEEFIDYNGNIHLPWYNYLRDIRWQIENKNFNYKRETVYNNGYTWVKF